MEKKIVCRTSIAQGSLNSIYSPYTITVKNYGPEVVFEMSTAHKTTRLMLFELPDAERLLPELIKAIENASYFAPGGQNGNNNSL
jgi:hypothetical protein